MLLKERRASAPEVLVSGRSAKLLELVGFLRVAETGQARSRARFQNLDADGRLAFRPRFAQDRKRGQRLVVDLRDEKRIAAIVLLPNLADLDFFDGHATTVDRFAGCVNNRPPS